MAAYRDRFHESRMMGEQAANEFVRICESLGYDIIKSTRSEDMKEHWDYKIRAVITPKEGTLIPRWFKIDVKAAKRVSRTDDSHQHELIWIEFTNVRGNPGWLYGQADYVAFQQEEGFCLISRQSLVELSESLINLTEFTKKPEIYKSYRRKSRELEHLGLISIKDVLSKGHMWVNNDRTKSEF